MKEDGQFRSRESNAGPLKGSKCSAARFGSENIICWFMVALTALNFLRLLIRRTVRGFTPGFN